jgi:hypothetical protein
MNRQPDNLLSVDDSAGAVANGLRTVVARN